MLRRPEFTACYDTGRRFFSRHFVVFARMREPGEQAWRMGTAVTKKLGTAVVRNRVKRVLREFFRLEQRRLPPALDIIVVPKRTLDPDRVCLDFVRRELVPVVEELRVFASGKPPAVEAAEVAP